MEFIEFSAKTVEDAITEASIQLGVPSSEIEYEVIEKGSAGFLGIGSKNAIIKARKIVAGEKKAEKPQVKEAKKEIKKEAPKAASKPMEAAPKKSVEKSELTSAEAEAKVKEFLSSVFEAMNMEVEILVKIDETDKLIDVELKGDDMGILIGKRGQTLDSLQYLTNLAVNKHADNYYKVKVDTEDYRKRRKETLENLAKNIAFKVKKTRRPVALEPMNPFERRVIHSALQNDRFVTTHSEGDEPNRHVVVTLKK